MWACSRCGERNSDLVSACSVCAGGRAGQAVDHTCESCGAPVAAEVRRCEACERAMTDVRPAGRLAKVWSCTSEPEAELLRVALRRAGIGSVLENVGGASFAIGLGTVTVPFVITVAEADAGRALDVLRAERDRTPAERYIPPVAMLRFDCACGKTLEVPPDFQGLDMDCPYCGRALRAG